MLNLVENYQASEILQCQLSVREESPVGWELEVEPMHLLAATEDLPCERRFPDLASAEEAHHWTSSEALLNRPLVKGPPDHG